jgi:DNA-binding NtrC family response regulator
MHASPLLSQPTKALRVLLVENDAMIVMALSDVLAEMGYDVCATEVTEAGAVAAAVRCKPDVMIVDAILEDGSGIVAVEQILCSGFIPHVFISGDISRVQACRPGAVALQKPFREPDLVRALQHALGVRPSVRPRQLPIARTLAKAHRQTPTE